METSEGETAKVETAQEVKEAVNGNEKEKDVAMESENAEKPDSNKAAVDENNSETKENDQSEDKKEDDETKVDEKPEEKTTTETIMEIDGKKVKKTTGGAKKVPPSSIYKSNDREAQKQDRKKRAIEMRRRTLLISNITVEDIVNEKVKNVLESCYHCQIRFLQIKDGKRGIAECRFNTVEDATKAETELKEVVVEDRTIGIRNLEERAAPSTWYEIGKELDKYLKTGESGKDEVDGEKAPEPQKDPLEEELASCDEAKTLVLLNLPLTTTEDMLLAIFSEANKIRMPVDDAGQCKGHAILEFEAAEVTTECRTKYEGISIEDDQDDRLIYVQTIKEYKEKSKAKDNRRRISSTRRRSSRERSRILQSNWIRRGLIPRRGMRMRGRYRSNWRQDSPKSKMDQDRKLDVRSGRRDGDMNWGQNMIWNSEMMSNMPNLLSMMGMNPFMGNAMNFQSNQYDSNRNNDDYRNRKRKMNDDQDFYRGDNRRGGGSGGGNWKNRRYDNQDSYGSSGGSYGARDRGNRVSYRDRNSDNRSFRKPYY